MTLGTILGASFKVLRRNPGPTFGFAVLLEGALAIATVGVIALVAFIAFARYTNADQADRSTIAQGSVALILLSYLVPVTLAVFAAALLQGIISLEVARATLGEKHTLRGLWRQARGRLWVLIGWTWAITGIVVLILFVIIGLITLFAAAGGTAGIAIAVILGILAFFGLPVLGFWLATKLAFVPSALMLDRLTLGKAIARSWTISRGYFWRTLGIMLLVAVILNVVQGIAGIPLQILGGIASSLVNPQGDPSATITVFIVFGLISLIFSLVVGAVATVAQSSCVALLYIDLRMRKEGLDLALERFVEARHSGQDAVLNPYLPDSTRGTEPA